MKRTRLTTLSWLTLRVLLLAMVGPTVQGAAGGLAAGEVSSSGKADPAAAPPRTGSAFFTPPTGACSLAAAVRLIRDDTRALAFVDARLYELIAPTLDGYLQAAAGRRRFGIALLPILDLDDRHPEELRAALHGWHAAKPELEGALFVGNIKLPSFFLPRADIHSVRLWPRYFEDLDMTVTQRVAPGTVLRSEGTATLWPKIVGTDRLVVPPHDFDDLAEGRTPGPMLWAAFLPVGYAEPSKNTYAGWAAQLDPFFKQVSVLTIDTNSPPTSTPCAKNTPAPSNPPVPVGFFQVTRLQIAYLQWVATGWILGLIASNLVCHCPLPAAPRVGWSLLTLLDESDSTRLATGDPESGWALQPENRGNRRTIGCPPSPETASAATHSLTTPPSPAMPPSSGKRNFRRSC